MAYRRVELPITELVRRYQGGESMYALAKRYRVSARTIRNRLVGAGVEIRADVKRRAPLPTDELAQRYQAGETIEQLADTYGVGASTISRRLKSAGVSVQYGRPDVDPDDVARLHADGLPIQEIADRLGTKWETVKARLNGDTTTGGAMAALERELEQARTAIERAEQAGRRAKHRVRQLERAIDTLRGGDQGATPAIDRLRALVRSHGTITSKEARRHLGVADTYAHTLLKQLCDSGEIERVARGRYRLRPTDE